MTQLAVYLICAAFIVVGALAFIRALGISGRIRMALACIAAAVPAAAGIWIFCSSGLRLTDFNRLLRNASADLQQITQGLKETQANRKSLQELLGPVREMEHPR